jgi:hypothetical protein
MFYKLLVIILAIGGSACALLVHRQHRVELAHEVAQAHNRLLQHERVLWELRTEIAGKVRPAEVRRLVEALGGTWVPIPAAPDLLHVPRSSDESFMPGMVVTDADQFQPASYRE